MTGTDPDSSRPTGREAERPRHLGRQSILKRLTGIAENDEGVARMLEDALEMVLASFEADPGSGDSKAPAGLNAPRAPKRDVDPDDRLADGLRRLLELEDLRVSAERYRNIVETADEGIWTIDAEGRTSFVNPKLARMLGYSVAEMLGRPFTSFLNEQEWSTSEDCIRRGHERGAVRQDLRFRRKDGSAVWVSVAISPLHDGGGRYTGALAMVTDLTARKQAEARLEEREAELRSFCSSVPLMMGFVELVDGDIVHIFDNDLSLAFFRQEGVADPPRPIRASVLGVTPEHIEFWTEKYSLSEALGHGVNFEYFHYNELHQKMWISVNVAPVGDFHKLGRRRFCYIIENITPQKENLRELESARTALSRLNDELEQRITERTAQLDLSNRELQAFSYSVSHDLRAPLRGIEVWSLALLEDCGDNLDERGRGYLSRVRSEAQRMGQLIDDMLHLSRVTLSVLQRGPVDLSGLAETIVARLREAEPDRDVACVIQPGLHAQGDAGLLGVALTNLLENAWKFTRQRPAAHIEFAREVKDGVSVFFVRDDGAGFDLTYADKLFAPFQRMHVHSDFPGTGIGLATVQRIVHRHGGRVWVDTRVDEGATFYFTLEHTP